MRNAMMRNAALLLALALLLWAVPCALGEGEPEQAARELPLGDSGYSIVVPAGFVLGDMTESDLAEHQVGYYYSEETALDFDVYVVPNAEGQSLADYIAASAAGVVTECVTDQEISGIPVAYCRAVEEYEEAEYETLTYVADAGEAFVRIVFWLDGEDAERQANEIIHTLAVCAKVDPVD